MRKFILVVALFALSVIVNAQQAVPCEFFGLKLGIPYTLDQIKSHIGDDGTYLATEDSIEFSSITWRGYSFQNVTFNDRQYPSMMVLTLNSNIFGGVLFAFDNNNIPAGQTLDTIYNELCEDLSRKYNMMDSSNPDTHTIAKISMSEEGSAVMVAHKETEDNNVVSVAYLSMSLIYSDVFNAILPTIQDTFFGMKMGSFQTISSIKTAIGYKGTVLSEDNDSFGHNITFKDLMFAGSTWDFGTFRMTDKGELYMISVEISLKDYMADDRNEANSVYELFKSRLSEKYGAVDESSDQDGKSIHYVGNNDIVLELSNQRGRSKGGDYRRYVILNYWDMALLEQMSKQSNDEL